MKWPIRIWRALLGPTTTSCQTAFSKNETAYRHGIDPCGNDIPKTAEETIRWLEARVKELEASNARLVKSLAAYGKYAYTEDRDIDALRAANADLAMVLQVTRGFVDDDKSEYHARLGKELDVVIARHAAGEPDPFPQRSDPRYRGTDYKSRTEPAKHPDTDNRFIAAIKLADEMHLGRCASGEPFTEQDYRNHACKARDILLAAINATRKEEVRHG